MSSAIERLTTKLPDAKRETLEELLLEAEDMILAYTGRWTFPEALTTAKIQLAVVLYNQQGIEGQAGHSEGGVSRTMETMPEKIRKQIAPYRLARMVNVHAAKRT